MYIAEKMNFERVKTKIDPFYLPFVEFLESLEVAATLTNEAPLFFQYGELMQNCKLQVLNNKSCDFTILCNKETQRIDIECVATHNNIKKLTSTYESKNLIDYFDSKYKIKINRDQSTIQDDSLIFKLFCYFEFDKIPTIEQVSYLYHDLFLEKGVKEDDES